MKVAITGPRGNLGSHLLKKNPYEVITIDRDDWGLLDKKLDNNVDLIIHTAYDLKTALTDGPSSLMQSNLMTTTALLESMKKFKIPRIMFISSCAVYGKSMVTQEELPCTPISINGTTKYLNEQLIENYCSQNNIKYEIYRVFNTYGGNDQFSIVSHLKKSIENKTPFRLNNNGLSQRDFIHVNDVANILIKLIDLKHSFTHLNIGSGSTIKIKELINIALKKYPHLKLEQSETKEAEYSRADVCKLNSLIEYDFNDLRDYLKENL